MTRFLSCVEETPGGTSWARDVSGAVLGEHPDADTAIKALIAYDQALHN